MQLLPSRNPGVSLAAFARLAGKPRRHAFRIAEPAAARHLSVTGG